MKTVSYGATVLCLLSALLAFTAEAAVALTIPPYVMPSPGTIAKLQAAISNPAAKEFFGQAKAGGPQQQKRGPRRLAQANGATKSQFETEEATVARVDRFGKCLHVFSKPSVFSKEIACIPKGEKLRITNLFSNDRRWVQLDRGGWVAFSKLNRDLIASATAARSGRRGQSATSKRASTGRSLHFRVANYSSTSCYYPGYYGWY